MRHVPRSCRWGRHGVQRPRGVAVRARRRGLALHGRCGAPPRVKAAGDEAQASGAVSRRAAGGARPSRQASARRCVRDPLAPRGRARRGAAQQGPDRGAGVGSSGTALQVSTPPPRRNPAPHRARVATGRVPVARRAARAARKDARASAEQRAARAQRSRAYSPRVPTHHERQGSAQAARSSTSAPAAAKQGERSTACMVTLYLQSEVGGTCRRYACGHVWM